MSTASSILAEREAEHAAAHADHAAAIAAVRAAELRFDDDPATGPALRAARDEEAAARDLLARAERRRAKAQAEASAAEKAAAREEFDAHVFDATTQHDSRVESLARRLIELAEDIEVLSTDVTALQEERRFAVASAAQLAELHGFRGVPEARQHGDLARILRTRLGVALHEAGKSHHVAVDLLDAFPWRAPRAG